MTEPIVLCWSGGKDSMLSIAAGFLFVLRFGIRHSTGAHMNQPRFWILVLMISLPAALRVVDHPWNIAPIGALALFAGAHFRDLRWAFLVPLAAMFLSDVGLGLVRENFELYTFHKLMPLTYGCYAVSVLLGIGIRRSWRRIDATQDDSQAKTSRTLRKSLPVATGTLFGSILFFFVTNLGVWVVFPTYPHTWEGLVQCYTAALPFFRNTLASDAFYVALLFGGFALLQEHLGWSESSGLLHAK